MHWGFAPDPRIYRFRHRQKNKSGLESVMRAATTLQHVQTHLVPLTEAQNLLNTNLRGVLRAQLVRWPVATRRMARYARSVPASRLIKLASNPHLLASEGNRFPFQPLLSEVIAEGAPPKIRQACLLARNLARQAKKSVIWTTFRANVESIADQLRDLNAVFIHGGIDAGLPDDDTTREGRIKQFRDDPNCFVMVAKPA